MEELIQRLNQGAVRYLVIGGHALRLLGAARATMDWDLFIPPRDAANLNRLNLILEDVLDMPIEPLGPQGQNFLQTYQTQFGIIQFHLGVPGLPSFDAAEANQIVRQTESGTPIKCVSGRDLIKSKEAAGRPQDLLDLVYLRELDRLGKLR
ncbi:MAG: hypothetical protein JWM99_4113 [Verrucomicrobiales bacterium]|nr:hypothetical protein [Verrucomicrobiales bacterium]